MPVAFNIGINPSMPVSASGYRSSMQAQMRKIEDAYATMFEAVRDVSPEVIYNALLPTKTLAEYYTPVKTGKLRASSYLEVTDRGDTPRVELGFSKGGDPAYGAYVHEMVQNYHAPPTRSKFLQAAVLEDLPNVARRLVEGYQTQLGL